MTPMPVIIVFAGNQISDDIKAALIKSGIAVELSYQVEEQTVIDKNGNPVLDKKGKEKKKIVTIYIEDNDENLKQIILYMLGYNIFSYIKPKNKIK